MFQIWDIADSKCMGQLDKTGFFIALKMIALAQNAKRVDLSNVKINVPPPNMVSYSCVARQARLI